MASIQKLAKELLFNQRPCTDMQYEIGTRIIGNEQIKAHFNELYQQMNGMPLREMDNIIYPVCKLCRDHERAGFVEGLKIGIHLAEELAK